MTWLRGMQEIHQLDCINECLIEDIESVIRVENIFEK
jgi:hypothetical protein